MLQIPLPDTDKDYLLSFQSHFPGSDAAKQYLYDSWQRIQIVLQWLAELQATGVKKVLELGSNPYHLTLLLKKYCDFELHLANYFEKSDQKEGIHLVENGKEKFEFRYRHFNIEADRFPYEDQSFDCVTFCEILEHLLLNPDFAVAEISRVLRTSGILIVSTPNATRLANLVRLAKGLNIYDSYSPYGAYGRHNREYTLAEVRELLERHSFEIVRSRVTNIYPHPWKSRLLQSFRPQIWYEHIFVMGRKKN